MLVRCISTSSSLGPERWFRCEISHLDALEAQAVAARKIVEMAGVPATQRADRVAELLEETEKEDTPLARKTQQLGKTLIELGIDRVLTSGQEYGPGGPTFLR